MHGSDLRCGDCEVKPKVEDLTKTTTPLSWMGWQVSAMTVCRLRSSRRIRWPPARRHAGRPLGLSGDSGDQGARPARPFYPFVMMDIPAGNGLPNPYSDNAAGIGQPPFPWRERILLAGAREAGSPNESRRPTPRLLRSSAARRQANFGAWNGNTIFYGGPSEWSFGRFILHYAKLCVAAGGVDAFLIGSE